MNFFLQAIVSVIFAIFLSEDLKDLEKHGETLGFARKNVAALVFRANPATTR